MDFNSFIQTPDFIQAWAEFKTMRKAKKKVLSEQGEKRQLTKLNELYLGCSQDSQKVIKHLYLVIDSCWDNIYRDSQHLEDILKTNNGSKSTTNQSSSKSNNNYFNFDKGEKYYDTAEKLRGITEQYDFVGRVAQ
jgi:hypothetical protein